MNEYVFKETGSEIQDICCSISSGVRCFLFERNSDDLVRNILLGQSFDREVPQQFAFWVMVSQASITRSVLRNWDSWSFIVSGPRVLSWFCVCDWDWCCRVGDFDIPWGVFGRLFAQSAFNCSIEVLRDLRVRAGAVDGLSRVVSCLSLADRLGRNGLESFLLNLPGIGGGGSSFFMLALASAARALHDLARLIDRGRIEALLASLSSAGFSVVGVVAFRDVVGFGFRSGSRGRGLFDAGPVAGPFANSICLTDLFRLIPLLVALMNDRKSFRLATPTRRCISVTAKES